jgi:hypothetical protein
VVGHPRVATANPEWSEASDRRACLALDGKHMAMTASFRTFRIVRRVSLALAASCCVLLLARLEIMAATDAFKIRYYDVAGCVLAPAAVAANRWAAHRAAAAKRRVCQHCGYSLKMIDSRRCPECGKPAPLVGRPRNSQEHVIAALRGRRLHDLEPRQRLRRHVSTRQ